MGRGLRKTRWPESPPAHSSLEQDRAGCAEQRGQVVFARDHLPMPQLQAHLRQWGHDLPASQSCRPGARAVLLDLHVPGAPSVDSGCSQAGALRRRLRCVRDVPVSRPLLLGDWWSEPVCALLLPTLPEACGSACPYSPRRASVSRLRRVVHADAEGRKVLLRRVQAARVPEAEVGVGGLAARPRVGSSLADGLQTRMVKRTTENLWIYSRAVAATRAASSVRELTPSLR